MKTKEKLGTATVKAILAKLSEGIDPVINNLDLSKLDAVEKQNLLVRLEDLEAKALEVRRAFD
ncbi:MAG: hypothetical protein ACI9XO_005053 [Paraglaciecola sp.]|jgi:hypothetical protein